VTWNRSEVDSAHCDAAEARRSSERVSRAQFESHSDPHFILPARREPRSHLRSEWGATSFAGSERGPLGAVDARSTAPPDPPAKRRGFRGFRASDHRSSRSPFAPPARRDHRSDRSANSAFCSALSRLTERAEAGLQALPGGDVNHGPKTIRGSRTWVPTSSLRTHPICRRDRRVAELPPGLAGLVGASVSWPGSSDPVTHFRTVE
jgi:hypothetical protein